MEKRRRRSSAWSDPGPEAPPTKAGAAKKPAKKRKKLTKAQAHAAAHTGEALGKTTSMYVGGLVKRAQSDAGDLTIATLKDAGRLIIGIPCPSLAFEYLVCNTVIPLEKVLQIYGRRGIGKSGLAFEMMRLFRRHKGIGVLLEHETKFNPNWASSIIGWDDLECMGVIPCDAIDDWQSHLQKSTTYVKKIMTGDSKTMGAGRIFPFLAIVDSIMGKTMREPCLSAWEASGRSSPRAPTLIIKGPPWRRTPTKTMSSLRSSIASSPAFMARISCRLASREQWTAIDSARAARPDTTAIL